MPMTKHKIRLFEQQLTDHLGLTPSIDQGLKIPFRMRPTDLAAQRVEAKVGCPAIRTQDYQMPAQVYAVKDQAVLYSILRKESTLQ